MGAERVTRMLGGRWHGRYGLAFCPAHENRRKPALSLADGDDGKLLVHCFAGCHAIDVLRAIEGGSGGLLELGELRRPSAGQDGDRRLFALKLWQDARPATGTLAELYLRGRAISGALPPSLRFHPGIKHAPSRTKHPAMIALVTSGESRKALGIHRTYLSPGGVKAAVSPEKMMLGQCGGGAVRLRDVGAGALVVCEGIETGLSLCDGLGGECRVWAALSTSGVAGLMLPKMHGDLVIAPDGDAPGRKAAEHLARRADATGWIVRIMQAPRSQDWNDLAKAAIGKVPR